MSNTSIGKYIIMLAALTAMAPLAIDAYLPAIPAIAGAIDASVHDVELSISVFLGGFALGQLIGGPYSDHFGRRTAIFTGLSLFILGSAGIVLFQSLESLLICRAIQAFGGGIAVINSTAVIRDISSGKESAKHLGNIGVLMMIAPLVAPFIGLLILKALDWQFIFVLLGAYALFLVFFMYRSLPETRVVHTDKVSPVKRYLMVLTHRDALSFILAQAFASAGMFAFITGSPSIYMGHYGMSEQIYPFVFGLNVVTLIAANRINLRKLSTHSSRQLMTLGQLIQWSAGAVLFTTVMLGYELPVYVFVGLIMVFIGAMGFVFSNSMACTAEYFPHNAATATALLGAIGFAAGGLSGSLVGIFGDGTPLPTVCVLFTCATAGLVMRKLFATQPLLENDLAAREA